MKFTLQKTTGVKRLTTHPMQTLSLEELVIIHNWPGEEKFKEMKIGEKKMIAWQSETRQDITDEITRIE